MIDIFIWFLFASFIFLFFFFFYYFDFNTEGFDDWDVREEAWWYLPSYSVSEWWSYKTCTTIWSRLLISRFDIMHFLGLNFCVLLFLIFNSGNSVHAINDDDMNIWLFSDYHKQIHHLSTEIADNSNIFFHQLSSLFIYVWWLIKTCICPWYLMFSSHL